MERRADGGGAWVKFVEQSPEESGQCFIRTEGDSYTPMLWIQFQPLINPTVRQWQSQSS